MNETPAAEPGLWRRRLHDLRARARQFAAFGGGVAAALIALLLYTWLFPVADPLTLNQVQDTVAQTLASATPPPAYSARVYQAIQPSLVLIQTEGTASNGAANFGIGSGVVIDDRGDILTSLHVVSNAATIRLTFADGTQSPAQVTARQPENDIAVLQPSTPPAQIFPATLGNPNAMQIGDEAFVVGHPLGLYGSMSSGVISGFNRSFKPTNSDQALEGLIQIDAAVNPGNSGGPLLNRDGQVIGIVAGLVNPTDQEVFIGLGFAVPITVAGQAAGLPPY